MYRKSFIIKKENLFKWVESDQISRIELANSYNKSLRDKTLCKIYAYFKIDPKSIIGILSSVENQRNNIENSSDHAFLTGIQSVKSCGYITEKMINKLREIEKRNHVNFSIPKSVILMEKRRIKE
jgi:hypothetical protein